MRLVLGVAVVVAPRSLATQLFVGLLDPAAHVGKVLVRCVDRRPLALDLGLPVGQTLPQTRQVLRNRTVQRRPLVHRKSCCQDLRIRNTCPLTPQRVCGNPRSTFDVAGSGQRDVTTFERV